MLFNALYFINPQSFTNNKYSNCFAVSGRELGINYARKYDVNNSQ